MRTNIASAWLLSAIVASGFAWSDPPRVSRPGDSPTARITTVVEKPLVRESSRPPKLRRPVAEHPQGGSGFNLLRRLPPVPAESFSAVRPAPMAPITSTPAANALTTRAPVVPPKSGWFAASRKSKSTDAEPTQFANLTVPPPTSSKPAQQLAPTEPAQRLAPTELDRPRATAELAQRPTMAQPAQRPTTAELAQRPAMNGLASQFTLPPVLTPSSAQPLTKAETTAPPVDSNLQAVVHHERPKIPLADLAMTPPTALSMAQHIIQIGDELDIAFPYQPIIGDATAQRLQPPLFRNEMVVVREDGMIVLPLIEPVAAAGLTPEEVRDELMRRYLPLMYDPLANLKSGTKREYRLCVNDEVDIRVRNQPEVSDVVTVRPDGRITIQRVGSIIAEGKTVEELTSEVIKAIEELFPQPEVSITLRQFHSDIVYEGDQLKRIGLKNLEGISVIVRTAERSVFVMGEVRTPRQIAYRGTLTLNQAVAAAGGPLRTAKLKTVKILRRTDPQTSPNRMLVDMRQTIRGEGGNDVPLHHLDVVVVGKTPIARFTDTLEQYLFNIVPFTRNNPNFNFFYSLGGGGGGGALLNP